MKKSSLLLGAAALALALSACAGPAASPGSGGGDPKAPAADVSPVGTWGVPDIDGEPYLELSEGGALAGSDGCNRLVSTWEADDGGVDFGDMASTMMACEGVDTWLSAADEAVISGTTMTIVDGDDAIIGTLELQ